MDSRRRSILSDPQEVETGAFKLKYVGVHLQPEQLNKPLSQNIN